VKAFVEWNAITRHYYVRLETRRAPVVKAFDVAGEWDARGAYEYTTRKAEAERAARRLGASEVVHVERDVVRALENNLGMAHGSALECAREWFR
jgi:hypothetical protein